MIASREADRPPVVAPTALLAGSLALLGLLSNLPWFLGPAIGGGGALVATVLRSTGTRRARGIAFALPIVALVVLAASVPPVASSELVAGFGAVALLVWTAADPGGSAARLRHSAPTVAVVGLVLAVAFLLSVALPSVPYGLGIAGAVAAGAVLLIGFGLARAASGRDGATATD